MKNEKHFEIKLKKSMIGCSQKQRDTVRCLGLRKIGQTKKVIDNPAIRGAIFSVQHLVEVVKG